MSVVYLGDYDIFIVTSEADQDNANKLADVLVKFCKVCCAYDLTVYPESEIGKNKLEHLDSGLAHSTYGFIFVDNGFQLDELAMYATNTYGLREMINRQDWSIIPVKAHQAIVMPSLLRTFRFLDVHKLLKGKRLEDIDVNSLTETDIDKALLSSIVKMLSKGKSAASAASRQLTGEQSPRPSSQHSEILRKHYFELVKNMDPDSGLLGDLFTANIISSREMESIRRDRNKYLITVLMRKNEKDFMKFVEVLNREQSHIADILQTSLPDV